ncbi:MAG: choice-of-anchor D domain-containing protein [Myxococcales bacterium]|nr:choice-of-anchor D domain-containing protein [Myxococcales bacterium]
MGSRNLRFVAPVILLAALAFTPSALAAAPDLVCSIEAKPDPKTGFVTLTLKVNNIGDDVAEATGTPKDPLAYIWFHSDSDPTLSENPDGLFETLVIGPSEEVSQDFVYQSGIGAFTAWCEVNKDLGPPFGRTEKEEQKTDNNKSSTPYVMDPPPPTNPDLVITGLTGSKVDGGGPFDVAFEVTVKNQGDEPSGGFAIDVYVGEPEKPDWDLVGSSPIFCQIPTLTVNQTLKVDCGSYNGYDAADVGVQTIYVYVDKDDEIVELDELNNDFEADIIVSGPPDLVATKLEITSDKADVAYTVTFQNTGGDDVQAADVCLYFNSADEPSVGGGKVSDQKSIFVPAGQTQQITFNRTGTLGGDYTAWVVLDCFGSVEELDEANNATSLAYSVVGIPNEPPVFESITAPPTCTETTECEFTSTVADLTGLPLAYELVDGPEGFYVDPALGSVTYVPPLGSAAGQVSATLRVRDQGEATADASVTFNILPSPLFSGVVGQVGSMPNSTSSVCPMVEVPGRGFAYVDRDARRLRFFAQKSTALDKTAATTSIELGTLHAPPSPLWSCHVEAYPGGGYVVFETASRTAVFLPTVGAARKMTLPVTGGLTIYSEQFRYVGDGAMAFFTIGADARIVLMSLVTGKLDPQWGGNVNATPTGGTLGMIDLYDASTAPGVSGLDIYSNYFWTDGETFRVYNRFNTRQELIEVDRDGAVIVASRLTPWLPPDPVPNQEPLWSLMADPNGGLQILDIATSTLRWYRADYRENPTDPLTFSPNENFALRDPNLPVGTPTAPGFVYLQAYGLSANNADCSVLESGGFSCHDVAEQRGYVLNEFGDYWKNCPELDVSPGTIDFGAVPAAESRTRSVTIANRGGGTLVLTSGGIPTTPTAPGGSFNLTGLGTPPRFLPPGSTITVDVTYSPQQSGSSLATLVFGSNACIDGGLNVPLIGSSGPRLTVTPSPITFTGVSASTHSKFVDLVSVGSSALSINLVQVQSAGGKLTRGTLTRSSGPVSLPAVLQPGERLSVEVLFDGTTPGSYTGSLVVSSSDAGNSVQEFPITATTTAEIRSAPAGFNFGAVAAGNTGTRSLVLRNRGFTPITFQPPVMTASSAFTLDTSSFVNLLAPGATTTLTLEYRPTRAGTDFALVTVEHDAESPPITLHAAAGTGTSFPFGFTGTIDVTVPAGGPIDGDLAGSDQFLHVSTGGFLVGVGDGNRFAVIQADGALDPWFGDGGTFDVKAAFPELDGVWPYVVELPDGGFALLDPGAKRIVALRADGVRHPYFGTNGVIELGSLLAPSATLGAAFVATANGLLVGDTENDVLSVVTRDGVLDPTFAGGTGKLVFKGAGTVVGGGLATGVGNLVGVIGKGTLLVADAQTTKVFTFTPEGQAPFESATGALPSFGGTFWVGGTNRIFYFDASTGLITKLITPLMGQDTEWGNAGTLNANTPFPGATFSRAFAAVDEERIAVVDTVGGRIGIVERTGKPYVALPKAVIEPPPELAFGVVPVGVTSAPKSIDVTNNGNVPLVVTALFDQPDFHLAAVQGVAPDTITVPAGATRTLNIVYEPKIEAQMSAFLRILTNDPTLPEVGTGVLLTGSTGGRLVVSPDLNVIDFGAVAAGQDAVRSFTLRNAGADPLALQSVAIVSNPAGAFTLNPPIAATTLDPGEAPITVTVRFVPVAGVNATGTVTISASGGTQRVIGLLGADAPRISVNPTEIACEGAELGKKMLCGQVAIGNVGSQPLVVAGFDAVGIGFEVLATPGVVAPGGAPIIARVFVTPGQAGESLGALRVSTNDTSLSGPATVPVRVRTQATLLATPSELDFGAVPAGQTAYRTVQVSGPGGARLLAASLTGSLAFGVASAPVFPATLGSGASIAVRCSPNARGTFTGTLALATDQAASSNIVIPLVCRSGDLLTATPSTVDFGAVAVGTSRTIPVVLENTGSSPVTIDGASATGTGFSVDLAAVTLAPGDTTAVFPVFAPEGKGDVTGSLTVTGPAGTLATVALSGSSGPKLLFVAADGVIDFGVRAAGTITTRSALLVNAGSEPVLPSAPVLTGSGVFTQTSTFDESAIAPGAYRVIELAFEPLTVGVFASVLSVESSAGSATVDLLGRTGGALAVSPTELNFGAAVAGQAVSLPLVVRNDSPSDPVTINWFLSGSQAAFKVVGLNQGDVLQPGEVRSGVKVSFDPSAPGDYAGTLTFYSKTGVEDGAIDVALTGKSGARVVVVEPRTGFLGFRSVPVGTTLALPFRVAAAGDASLRILGFDVEGDAGAFAIGGLDALPVDIEPGRSLALQVVCAPNKAGLYGAVLRLATDDPLAPAVPVRLECTTPAAATVSPIAVEFGAVPALAKATKTVTLRNKGGLPLTVTGAEVIATGAKAGLALAKAFSGEVTVNPGGTTLIDVALSPAAAADYPGVLRISTSDPARPVILVPISGHSGPRLDLSPPVLNFCRGTGTVDVTVRNGGTSPLIIDSGLLSSGSGISLSAVWKDDQVNLGATTLEPGGSRVVLVSVDSPLSGGKRVASTELTFSSNDPDPNGGVLRIVQGSGLAFDDGFNGSANVLPPGAGSAFDLPGRLTGGLAELCTGGFVAASLPADPTAEPEEGARSLVYGYPGAAGAASALSPWGERERPGQVDLDALYAAANLDPTFAADFGAQVRTFGQLGLQAIVAPSAGAVVLIDTDGQLAEAHPSGGVLRVDDAAGTGVVVRDIAARAAGAFVVLDARGGQLLGLTAAGALDTTFGAQGRILLSSAVTGGVSASLDSIAAVPSGSVAVLDSDRGRIAIVTASGGLDTGFGEVGSGVIDISDDGGFAGVGAYGAAGLIYLQPAFGIVDLPTSRILAFAVAGQRNTSIGDGGVVNGVELSSGALVVTSTVAVATPANAGKLVTAHTGDGDLRFHDTDGYPLTKEAAALGLSGCPINIQGVTPGSAVGGGGSISLSNAGQGFLNVEALEFDFPELTCEGPLCDAAQPIPAGSDLTVDFGWAPKSGTTGCFETSVTITHGGVNGPTVTCPVLLGTTSQFVITPGGLSDSSSYTFPPQAVGTAYTREFLIRNAGCETLPLSNIVLGGSAPEQFELDKGALKDLAPGEIHRFTVTCKPQAAGDHSANLSFSTAPKPAPSQTTIRCFTGPVITPTPENLNWFAVPVGAGDLETLTLRSTGGQDATITPAAPGGPLFRITNVKMGAATLTPDEAAAVFQLVDVPDSGVLPIGSEAVVRVAFTPPTPGAWTATLEYTSDSVLAIPDGGVTRIPFTASSSPEVVFAPNPVDFGVVEVGAVGEVAVKATNIGGSLAPGYVPDTTKLATDGPWFTLTDDDEWNITAGQDLDLTLRCQPTEVGERTAKLYVEASDDANAESDFITLDLVCRGGSCVTAPELIDFGDVAWDQTKDLDITLSNPGSKDAIVTVAITGGDAGEEFAITAPTGESPVEVTVPAQGDATVTLTFDPLDVPGKRKGTLTLTDPGCEPTPRTIPVTAWSMPPGDEGDDVTAADPGTPVEQDDDLGSDGQDATDGTSDDLGNADGGTTDTTSSSGTIPTYSGCGCRTATTDSSTLPGGAVAGLVALLALGLWRRRAVR